MVEARCLGLPSREHWSLLRPDARLLLTAVPVCSKTSKFMLAQEVPLAYRVEVHNSCVCNELHALLRRHLVDRPTGFDPVYFRKITRPFLKTFNFNITRSRYSEIINNYVGGKRKMYIMAATSLKHHRYEKSWSVISMFVKAERVPSATFDDKAPRAIQFRKPQFNLIMASYLRPLEQAFYLSYGMLGLREVAKGLNNLDRASLLISANNSFNSPIYLMTDHSKFDSYVNTDHLKYLHKVYTQCYPGDKYLRYMLNFQKVNYGYSRNNVKYKIVATRMSGDYDTSLGNTLLNLTILRSWLSDVKHYIMLDGDDAVIIIEAADYRRLDHSHFDRCGFKTVIEVTSDIQQMQFCRSKLLLTDPPRFAREPQRALTHFSTSLKAYPQHIVSRYLAGVGLCELASSAGVPIIQPIAYAMSRLSDKPILEWDFKSVFGLPKVLPITDEVRVAYADAWGIDPMTQCLLEKEYTPPSGPCDLKSYYDSLPFGPI